MLGAHISSRSADRYIRPVLVAVLTISALGLLGVTNGWLIAAAIVSVVLLGVVYVTMRRNDVRAARSVLVAPATVATPAATSTDSGRGRARPGVPPARPSLTKC